MPSINSLVSKLPGSNLFARVILPFNLDIEYSYHIPADLRDRVAPGIRVEVQFGRSKLYAGMVSEVYHELEVPARYKTILSVLDEAPIITPLQLKTWHWLADYYCCNVGEVMAAALPAAFKLDSESKISLHPDFEQDFSELDDQEYLIAEALSLHKAISVKEVQKILSKKSIKKVIDQMAAKGIIVVEEELASGLRDKKEEFIKLDPIYRGDPDFLVQALDLVTKSESQTQVMLAFIQYARPHHEISRKVLSEHVAVTTPVLKAMVKKGIFQLEKRKVKRNIATHLDTSLPPLSKDQVQAITEIKTSFDLGKNVTLLHGVTGSGKTRVYSEFIHDIVEQGGQVLYLLPEIALTGHLINRLRAVLGSNLYLYHSRISQRERIETWHAVMQGAPVVLAARSGIFLPFKNLQLLIVDEEHDPSYKQHDPDPRYQARDTAIWLASQCGAKVILGSATPSIDSWYHAMNKKYGYAMLNNRFSESPLPEFELVDLFIEHKMREEPFIISHVLHEAILRALRQKEQIILFQNRRGYAPQQHCSNCHWHAMCPNCDVSLTYHKYLNKLICHYCGYKRELFNACPDCGKSTIALKGFGTEKIEDELKRLYPAAQSRRLDLDTARSTANYQEILEQFENKGIDILVGTQMISKGLDFDHVALVGILQADSIFYYPDFRSNERAYQLITQVAGRAGRKDIKGRVILQAYNLNHPVIKYILNYDYEGLAKNELHDRQLSSYPPYSRLIEITVKHKKPELADQACLLMTRILQEKFGERILGPLLPGIPRLRNFYLRAVLIKMEKSGSLIREIKEAIKSAIRQVIKTPGFSSTRFNVDVDPG
ncbi:MAG: primosomal protein N' [Saprospiraceae bacterium]|nr:primosomal protein N' [Saprospiraceae bacterium]